MTDFVKIRDDLKALEIAIVNGDIPECLRAGGTILTDAADVAGVFLTNASRGNYHVADKDKKTAQECVDCCERIKNAIPRATASAAQNAPANNNPTANTPKGALGDGTLLKLFLSSLPQILSMIQELIKPHTPTPAPSGP